MDRGSGSDSKINHNTLIINDSRKQTFGIEEDLHPAEKNRKRTFYKKSQKKFYIKFKKCIFTLWDIIRCFILKANNRQA